MIPTTIDWNIEEILDDSSTQSENYILSLGTSEEVHLELRFKKKFGKITITANITKNFTHRPISVELSVENEAGPLQIVRSEATDTRFTKDFQIYTPCAMTVFAEVDFVKCKYHIEIVDLKSIRMEMFNENATANMKIDFSDLSEMLFQEEFSDMTIVADEGEKLLHVHKAVLAARNPTFAYIFRKYKNDFILRFDGLPGDMLEELITFMYTGRWTTNKRYCPIRMLESLIIFNFENLIIEGDDSEFNSSEASVIELLAPQTVVDVLILADDYKLTKIRKAAIKFLVDRFNSINGKSKLIELGHREQLRLEIVLALADKSTRNTGKGNKNRRSRY